MHRFWIPRKKRMPSWQILPQKAALVSAARWKPAHRLAKRCKAKNNAFRHMVTAVFIVAAPAGRRIEKPTGNACVDKRAGVLVFKLVQAAEPTAIAKRLPFLRGKLSKRKSPKFGAHHHRFHVNKPSCRRKGAGPETAALTMRLSRLCPSRAAAYFSGAVALWRGGPCKGLLHRNVETGLETPCLQDPMVARQTREGFTEPCAGSEQVLTPRKSRESLFESRDGLLGQFF